MNKIDRIIQKWLALSLIGTSIVLVGKLSIEGRLGLDYWTFILALQISLGIVSALINLISLGDKYE